MSPRRAPSASLVALVALVALGSLGALASCKERVPEKPLPPAAGTSLTVADTGAGPSASAPPGSPSASSPAAQSSSAPAASASAGEPADAGSDGPAGAQAATRGPDAGAAPVPEDCRLLKGPAQLSLTGPASVSFGEGDAPAPAEGARIIFNREGLAGVHGPAFPALSPTAGPGGRGPQKEKVGPDPKLPLVSTRPAADRASWPACAVAGRFVFCMDHEGAIHRRLLSGEGDTVIARGRPGTSIAAVTTAPDHTLVAFLGNQKTTEGVITHAFAVLDEGPARQISEEGSGATYITIAARKGDVLAMYIDARVALSPVHARTLAVEGGKLKLGKDAVVFVGDGSDRRQSGAIATSVSGPSYLLTTSSDNEGKFGMAAIRVDGAPVDDSPVVWSHYANGLSPASLAATRGVSPVRVVRVRPISSDPSSWRVLELGHLDDGGVFRPLCNLLESRSFADIAIAVDPNGSVWIVYTSADGTWVEQRGRSS